MTRLKDDKLILEPESKSQCDLCGVRAETRPYGPRGENVCFKCGMKDEQSAGRAFKQRVMMADEVVTQVGKRLKETK